MNAPARSRRLATPRTVSVHADGDGVPAILSGTAVEAVREEWMVEDRWWTDRPLRRRYFELALDDGRNAVVFHDLTSGRWFTQRG
jgi:hypothetical protein